MSVAAQCGGCGKKYTLDDRFAGKKAKCRECGVVFSVPGAPLTAPVITTAPPNTAENPQARPPARRPAPPRPAARVEPGEVDFSALDDIEQSGKIDHAYVAAAPMPPTATSPRGRGSAAPAHLHPSAMKAAAATSPVDGKPKIALFVTAGLVLFGLVCFGIYKFTATKKEDVVAFKPPVFKDDGTGLTAEKYLRNIEARRQAEKDAVPARAVEKLALPVRTTFPELGAAQPNGNVNLFNVQLADPNLGEPMTVAVVAPGGEVAPNSLPCILLTATMADPLEGETLSEADLDEATAYARAGFAVFLYDTSRYSPNARPQKPGACVEEFMQSDGGQHFARNAINLVFARGTMVDPQTHLFRRLRCGGPGGDQSRHRRPSRARGGDAVPRLRHRHLRRQAGRRLGSRLQTGRDRRFHGPALPDQPSEGRGLPSAGPVDGGPFERRRRRLRRFHESRRQTGVDRHPETFRQRHRRARAAREGNRRLVEGALMASSTSSVGDARPGTGAAGRSIPSHRDAPRDIRNPVLGLHYLAGSLASRVQRREVRKDAKAMKVEQNRVPLACFVSSSASRLSASVAHRDTARKRAG